MNRPRIRHVAPAEADFALRVTWEDDSVSLVSLAEPIFRLKALAPLRDPVAFRKVRVSDWGWGVEWGEALDYSADSLWRLAREQSGKEIAAE